MNTKVLSVLGVMMLMVGGWFFYKENVKIEPAIPTAPTTSYEVKDIRAVQTNPDTGEVEYTLTADGLTKNELGIDEMTNIKMEWTPPSGETYHLSSYLAQLAEQSGDLVLKEGFSLIRKGNENKPDMLIQGKLLTGNTKIRQLHSDESVVVVQGEDSFVAQGFVADLQVGEYEFHRVQVQFAPPERQDKPLF